MNGNTKKINTIIALSTAVIGIIVGVMLINSPQNINERASAAASLSISPSNQEVNLDKSFTAQIALDSGDSKVTGFDLSFSFDPSVMKINDIKQTSELSNFNTVIKNDINNTTGDIRYAAFTFDKNLPISGKLNILTIYGNVPSSSTQGTYQIKIKDTSLIIAANEGQNILSNITNGEIKIIGGVPNSCGGTCGSNNNCQANYFCFEGFCRNPVCQTDTNCDCSVEATATPKVTTKPATAKPIAKVTAKPTVKPSDTPLKGGNETAAPISIQSSRPEIELTTTSSDLVDTDDLKNNVWTDFSKYLIGIGIITLFVTTLFFAITNYKKNKTHIMPPTNI